MYPKPKSNSIKSREGEFVKSPKEPQLLHNQALVDGRQSQRVRRGVESPDQAVDPCPPTNPTPPSFSDSEPPKPTTAIETSKFKTLLQISSQTLNHAIQDDESQLRCV